MGHPKKKLVFQASIFRCENVSFREGSNPQNDRNATELLDDLCELSMARTVARLVSGSSYGPRATALEAEAGEITHMISLKGDIISCHDIIHESTQRDDMISYEYVIPYDMLVNLNSVMSDIFSASKAFPRSHHRIH